MTKTKPLFAEINVDKTIVQRLEKQGITHANEIQERAVPAALDGKDIIGRSATGSGKTLAFSIPIVQELLGKNKKGVRALILTPTRELAKQVEEVFNSLSNEEIQSATVYGGVAYEPQYDAFENASIIVGTPGRLIDHLKKGSFDASSVEFFVLDEADRMLDMGFIDDIKYIVSKLAEYKQSFFFSATMPMKAKELAESFMKDPVWVATEHVYVNNDKLQEYYLDCPSPRKADLLKELIKKEEPELALVFVNSRSWSDALAKYLVSQGINAESLHGGHAQNKREKIVEKFESGKVHVVVATDVAARGLDIDDISHVFNFEVPKDDELYVHRIGRTARADKIGKAITLLDVEEHRTFSRIEADSLRQINKMDFDYRPKTHYLQTERQNSRRPNDRRGHGKPGHSRGPRKSTHNNRQKRDARQSSPKNKPE